MSDADPVIKGDLSDHLSQKVIKIGAWIGFIVAFLQCSIAFDPALWTDQHLANHLKWSLFIQTFAWLIYLCFLIYCLIKLPHQNLRLSTQCKVDARETLTSTAGTLSACARFKVKKLSYTCVAVLILTRISWWFSPPSPSEDVWRYLWDGERFYDSRSVYLDAPHQILTDEPFLERLQSRIGHGHIPTVYPPGAQIIFGLNAAISNQLIKVTSVFMTVKVEHKICIKLTTWRCLLLFADLAILAIILSLLRSSSCRPEWALFYVLNPLVAYESALGCHLDLFGVFFLIYAILKLTQGAFLSAGFICGIGISVKLLPLMLFFPLGLLFGKTLFSKDQRLHLPYFFLGGLISCILTCTPFIEEFILIKGIWPGLDAYQQHWSFNGSLYPALLHLLKKLNFLNHSVLALRLDVKLILLVSYICSVTFMYFKLKQGERQRAHNEVLILLCFWATFLTFIFSPVVFAWYLLWLVPFYVILVPVTLRNYYVKKLFNFAVCIGSIVWSFMINLTYLPRHQVLCGEGWSFDDLWFMIEYGLLALTLLLINGYTLFYSSVET